MTFDDKYEEWKKKQEEQSGSSSTSSFDSKYAEWQIKNNGEDIVKDISSRYETWMKNYKNFITNYNDRMASKGYKTDTAEWLSKTSQQKANFDAEAKNIQTLLDRYKDYLDADAYKNLAESLSAASKGQSEILSAYQSEHDFYSQFKDELDYDKYDSGWLDREYEVTAESAAKRKRVYDKVNNRIAELNKEIAKVEQEHSSTHFTSTGLPVYSWDSQDAKKQVEALQAEKEQLESEATMYRRWQGVVDSNYKAHANFDANAAKRDYKNISVDDLNGFEYPTGGVTSPEFYEIGRNGGYWGKDGNLYHADGTLAYKGEENFNFVLQDKLGAYLNTSESDYDKILYTLSGFENDDYAQEYALVRSDGKSKSWDYLTDTEIGIYYDLMKREGQASAYKFLDDMTTELNRRATEERSKRIQQLEGLELVFANAASIPMQLIGGATGFVSDVIDIVQGDEINPYSNAHAWSNDAQTIRGTTAEKIDKATGNASLLGISWGDMYQFGMSAADSLVGSAIGGTGYGVLMGMGAASSEMKELYDRGASTGQMLMGGLLAGAAEMVFEKISIDHFVNLGDPKAMKDVIVNILKQGGVEASEELFTEIANTISDAAVMGSQSEFAQNVQKYMAEGATQGEATLKALKDVGFNVYKAAVGGFFSGAGMGAGGASVGFVGSQIDYANQGRDIIDNRGVAALQNLANEMTANKAGLNAKQIGKLSQKVSDGNTANKSAEDVGFFAARSVGKLSDKMGETLDAQGKADIQKALVEKGLSKKDANRISNNIQRQLKGEKLSESELAEINDNEKVKEALTNLDAKTDEMKLRLGLARIGIDTSKTEAPTKTEVNTVDGMDLHKEVNAEGKVSENKEAKQISTGEVVTIDKSNPISKTEGKGKNLKVFYNTDKGVVEASDISYASEDDVVVYESFVDLGAAVANAAIKNYDGKMPVQEYVDGMRQGILMYGKYNFQGVGKDIFTESSFTALSETDQQFALKLGRAMSKSSATNADTAIKTAMSEAEAQMKANGKTATQKQGKVRFEEGAAAVRKDQRIAARVGEIVARATGRDVVFYDSTKLGKDDLGYNSNGYFNPKDGSIHLDLRNAKGEKQTILFTLSHELVHFAKSFDPVAFKEFSDFLVAEYGKHGVDVEQLVRDKMGELKTTDYDYAFEEVIADACERFLVDSNAIEKLNALGEKTWVDKIINKIMEFIKNVRDAYAQFTGRIESQKASEMTDVLDELYAKFESMVVGAAQTSQQMATLNIKPDFQAMQENASMSAIQGTQDGAATRTVYTATVAKNVKNQIKTEREAYPKMSMSVSGGASYVLNSIEGLTPTMIDGLVKGNKIAGFTGRQCREHAMVVSGFNAESVKVVNEFMDKMASFMEDAAVTYKFIGLNDVHNAKLHYNYNRDGSIKSIVLSAMVQNGDYPVNFDLTAICKKKEAMAKLLDKLSKRGSVDSGVADLTPSNIFKINKALKDAGYETACLGCFVESKRYNIKAWAEKFCAKWNAEVKKVNPNATYFDYGKSGVSVDDLTMEQVVKLDESVNKFTNESVTKRVQNALQKYKDKQAKGEPLFAKTPWSKAALERLEKSPTLSEALKDKYRTTPYEELTLDDVSVLLEHGILSGAALSNKQKIAQMVRSGEAYQHLLRPSDLITSDGISKLEELPNFHGVLYGHYGSGTPKLIQGFTPYNSEIALLPANKGDSTLAEYLYSIAGVRMQSFSDFQIQNVYDYLQMVGDLAARKLPAHAYTKEISFAKLFGMTGIKTNLSVMFDIDPSSDSEHAGLIKYNPLVHKGEYAKIVLEDDQGKWVYNIGDYATQRAFSEAYPNESLRFLQSIGFADAVKLQTTKGYSSNLGIIGVGYSDLGIVAMLNDGRIRYIIPYHKSGLPADVQVATNISLSRDYTSVQNNTKIVSITDANGNKVDWSIKEATKRLGSGQLAIIELADHIRNDGWKVETKKAQNGHGSFDLYGDLGVTNDPRETAKNYFDWCAKNNTLPVFFEFGWHDNYYKLLYDFNVYDCVTEKYAPQGAVTNTYPMQKGESIVPYDVTKGNFDSAYLESTIDKQMSFMNRYNETLDEDLDKLAENVEKGIYSIDPDAVWEQGIKTSQITIANRVIDTIGTGNDIVANGLSDVANSIQVKHQKKSAKETYSAIGKETLQYAEGNKQPDLTLVEIVNERTGKKEKTITHYGDKPKGYVPKKIAYCYKLFEQHPDGSLHALFAGAGDGQPIGEWIYAQGFPYTDSGVNGMNLRERYGWHLSAGLPSAPHLMSPKSFERGYPSKNAYGHPKESKRVWVRMAYDATNDYNSIADSTVGKVGKGDIFGLAPFGGYYAFKENNQSEWVISSGVKIDKILTEEERQQILKEAGYDEYEAWRRKHRATAEEKAEREALQKRPQKVKDAELASSALVMREKIKSRIIDNPELGIKHQQKTPTETAQDLVNYVRGEIKRVGSWDGHEVFDFFKGKDDINFVERIYAKDKDVKKDLAEFLSKIDDVKLLDRYAWFVGEAYKDKDRVFDRNTWKTSYPYRGAVTTFKNAIKKRINDIESEKVGGHNLGVKNGEISLKDAKALFDSLNSDKEIGEFAEKVFATCEKLGVNIRFANQVFSNNKVAGDALGDMVELKTSYFNDGAFSDQRKASTILHELIHACTVYVMAYNTIAGDVTYGDPEYDKIANAATRLNRIYGQIVNDPDFKGQYGLKDPREMVAELANPKFVELLKKKTLWDSIVDWICKLFGYRRGNSAYENARMCVDYMLDNPAIMEYKAHAIKMREAAWREGYKPFGKTVTEDGRVKYQKKDNSVAVRGVYINDSTQAFTEQILNGEKTIETREQPKNRKYPELHKFIGERIGIVRSGKGKTTLVGFATVADEIVYNTEAEFRADDDKHLVKKGSAYDIKNKKYGYVLEDVERVTPWEIPKGAKRNGMSDVDITAYHEGQPKFQMKEPTNRTILANALESTIDTSTQKGKNELKYLTEYKEKVGRMEELEGQLAEVKEKLKKGKTKELAAQKSRIEVELNKLDRRVVELNSMKPIRDLLAREKEHLHEVYKQRGSEALEAARDRFRVNTEVMKATYLERKMKADLASKQKLAKAKEYLKEYKSEQAYIDWWKKQVHEWELDALKDRLEDYYEGKIHEKELKAAQREFELRNKIKDLKSEQAYKMWWLKQIEAMKRKALVDNRKASDIRTKIKNLKQRLETSLLNASDKTYVPANLVQAIVDVCGLINTDSSPTYKRNGEILPSKAQAERELTKQKLQALKDEYENLKTHEDPAYSGEFDEVVYKYITKLRTDFDGKPISEMSRSELEEMYEILKSIAGVIVDARKLIGVTEAKSIYEAADGIIAEQFDVISSRKNKELSRVGEAKSWVSHETLSPMRNIERMSGYKEDSMLYKLFRAMEVGNRVKNKFMMEMYKKFESLVAGENKKNFDNAVEDEHTKLTDINGKEFGVSKMQMMQVILSYEREVANGKTDHFDGYGLTFADLKTLNNGDLKQAVSANRSHRVVGNASDIARQFAEALKEDKWCQDYMNATRSFFNGDAKDAVNEIMLVLKHRLIAKDKGYIPFESDSNYIVREISAMNDIQQTISSYGMLKETVQGAKTPLIITGVNNLIDRHIEQVGNIKGFAIPIRNLDKVWNVTGIDQNGNPIKVPEVIQRAWGNKGTEHIEQVVKDLQGNRQNNMPTWYRKLRSAKLASTFIGNASATLKILASMTAAKSMLDHGNYVGMFGNLAYTIAHQDEIAAEVDKYTASSWMRRQGLTNQEVHSILTEKKSPKIVKAYNKLPSWINATKWMTAMDYVVSLSLWKYAKQDVAKRTGLTGEELLKATAEYFDDVVEHTQSMNDVLHKPEIQKHGNLTSDMFGLFKTDLYQLSGLARTAIGRYSAAKKAYEANKTEANKEKLNKHGKNIRKALGGITSAIVVVQAINVLMAAFRYKPEPYEDEEDELTLGSFSKQLAWDFASDIAGYTLPLFGGEVVGILESIADKKIPELTDNMVLSALDDLITAVFKPVLSATEGELSFDELFDSAVTIANSFGLPASNMKRFVNAVVSHATDIANGEFLSFNANSDDKEALIYNAVLRGDAEELAELKSQYKDDNAWNSALATALKENDPRIMEAAIADLNGNPNNKRVNIQKGIIAEGKFTQDNVVAATNSIVSSFKTAISNASKAKKRGDTEEYEEIIKELQKKGYSNNLISKYVGEKVKDLEESEAEGDKEESIYKTADIGNAYASGDDALALEIIEDLIRVKTANSDKKTQKEREKEAKASVKASVTSYWKPLYKEAYKNKDFEETKRIRFILRDTGLYGNSNDVNDTCKGWLNEKED